MKQSFERSADVQEWIRGQLDEEGGPKTEFDPSFLSENHQRLWILSSLTTFYEQDLITDVLHVVKSGKEANVYCCKAHPATGVEYLAAKVYRPRMFRALKNDAVYRESREMLDGEGRAVHDRRAQRAAKGKNQRGRAAQITSWIQYEYQTQRLLYEAGAAVPAVVAQTGNAVLMEYIGDGDEAAPTLNRVRLAADEAQPLFDTVIRNIELFLRCDRVHGDLSAYNILHRPGRVTIIDFAQAVDARSNTEVFDLLARDIDRVCRYFGRYGVAADPGELAAGLWTGYLFGEL